MTSPAGAPTRHGGYMAPAIGIDAFKDAIATIRCLWAGDGQGFHAVLTGTDAPRHVAGALATIAVQLCHLGGLDDEGLDSLLGGIATRTADALLDQPHPDGPAEGVV